MFSKIFLKNDYKVDVYDPKVSSLSALEQYNIRIVNPKGKYDCIVGAVFHEEFRNFKLKKISTLLVSDGLLVDIKGIWRNIRLPRDINRWSL